MFLPNRNICFQICFQFRVTIRFSGFKRKPEGRHQPSKHHVPSSLKAHSTFHGGCYTRRHARTHRNKKKEKTKNLKLITQLPSLALTSASRTRERLLGISRALAWSAVDKAKLKGTLEISRSITGKL